MDHMLSMKDALEFKKKKKNEITTIHSDSLIHYVCSWQSLFFFKDGGGWEGGAYGKKIKLQFRFSHSLFMAISLS